MIDSTVYDYFDVVTTDNKDVIEKHITSWNLDPLLFNENTLKSLFRQCIVDDPESKYAYSEIVPKSSGEGYVSYKINGNVKLDLLMMIELIEGAQGLAGKLVGNDDKVKIIFALMSSACAVFSVMKQMRKELSPCMGAVAYCLTKTGCTSDDNVISKDDICNMIKNDYGYLLEEKGEKEINLAIENLIDIKSVRETNDGKSIYIVEKMHV